ncbi:MAG TPA: hypothetical protein VFA29_05575 [Candidatus Baltobacteraceae bacterium]|nr:hypothetical protein [Candidatus Baltobacteraceae bacterium]
MVWEEVIAFAAVGQLIAIVIGAIAAYLQLSGLRRQREADLIERIFKRLNTEELASALDFVYNRLASKLTEASYVREIHEGKATATNHPELRVMHFFNGLGLLVHRDMVGEQTIVPIIASPCMRSWDHVSPVVELMRRRYPHAYTPFESLVVRSRAVDLSVINSRFRAEMPHLKSEWESTNRDLKQRRIRLSDEGPTA